MRYLRVHEREHGPRKEEWLTCVVAELDCSLVTRWRLCKIVLLSQVILADWPSSISQGCLCPLACSAPLLWQPSVPQENVPAGL